MRDGRIVSDETVARAARRLMLIVALASLPFLYVIAATARAAPAGVPQRGPPPARDRAGHSRLAARHRDHDRLVRGRRHVHVVDPAWRVRTARPGRRGRDRRTGSSPERRSARRLAGFRDTERRRRPPADGRDRGGRHRRHAASSGAQRPTARDRLRRGARPSVATRTRPASRARRRARARPRSAPTSRTSCGVGVGDRDRGVRLRRVREARRGAGAAQARCRRLLAGRRAHVRTTRSSRRARSRACSRRGDPSLGAPPQSTVLVSNRGGVDRGRRRNCTRSSRALAARLGSLKYSSTRPRRRCSTAPTATASRCRRSYSSLGTFGGARGDPVARQHLLHARRRAEVGARDAARGRAAARIVDRRVRDRGLVLRGRRRRSPARSSASGSAGR